MADPGYPKGRLKPPRGLSTYYLISFSRKLHENEEILAGGGASLASPDPAMQCHTTRVLLDKLQNDYNTVADPRFPIGGAPTLGGGRQPIIWPFSSENYTPPLLNTDTVLDTLALIPQQKRQDYFRSTGAVQCVVWIKVYAMTKIKVDVMKLMYIMLCICLESLYDGIYRSWCNDLCVKVDLRYVTPRCRIDPDR